MMNKSIEYFMEHSYAWPGGYPMYGIMHDGECLCAKCKDKNKQLITDNTNCKKEDATDLQWRMVGAEINYEDEYLNCCHCGDNIQSAYGEEEE